MSGIFKLANTCLLIGASALASGIVPSAAQAFAVLYRFQGGNDGGGPAADLIRDAAGNLYGTTVGGGTQGNGVVFQLAPDGTETTLHSFAGGSDGSLPKAGLISDRQGVLYGTTESGGGDGCVQALGCGTVFKLTPDGNEIVLYRFQGGADGAYPDASLIADKAGNLYGTTSGGGGGAHCQVGCGTVFRLAADGTETILHAFTGKSDGAYPLASLILDKEGNLYGTTEAGGDKNCGFFGHSYECGTVFKLAPNGRETVLHAFTPVQGEGMKPQSSLVFDDSGNLYGTTTIGGDPTYQAGTVFKIAADGTETVLHRFRISDGYTPTGGLVRDTAGNLYGTTRDGGPNGLGIVFKLAPDGTETVLHSLSKREGRGPQAGLIADKRGRLYGTAAFALRNKFQGSVFEVHE
jgi:uncharacterized repeat protein (TIGR03803 family)